MIRAKLKGLWTTDMGSLENALPDDRFCFNVAVRMLVGPAEAEGEESFDVYVASPSWLELQCTKSRFVVGGHRVFVNQYDVPEIKKILTSIVERYSGKTWVDVARRLACLGMWEFEDYEEYRE
jgi:hypothetical protein